MLGYIKGKIIDLETNYVLILTDSGVGYEIIINDIIYSKLLNKSETEIFVYHNITESGQNLFGFLEKQEKEVFKELIKISGIGGKMAINILSLGIENLILAIKNEDNKVIEKIPGIGKKMASKIILELKDKDFFKFSETKNISKKSNSKIEKNLKNDVINSLSAMGYKKQDIEKVLFDLPENITNISEIIAFVIKNIK